MLLNHPETIHTHTHSPCKKFHSRNWSLLLKTWGSATICISGLRAIGHTILSKYVVSYIIGVVQVQCDVYIIMTSSKDEFLRMLPSH